MSGFPLSHGQRALWFLYKVAPQSVAYNLAGAGAIPGNCDLSALKRAFRRLARRQPMLRTTFSERDGEPWQQVLADPEVSFLEQDASIWSAAQLNRQVSSLISRPFDLERAPPWRVHILRGAPSPGDDLLSPGIPDHLILLTFHHIISDLWSIAVLMSEVVEFYREEVSGIAARLKPLRASYGDAVRRERELLAGARGAAAWKYWRQVLNGELPPIGLPIDRPNPAVLGHRGARHTFRLGADITGRIRSLADARHVAVPTVLLAGLQTLLHRYSGQEDILTGFQKAGRTAATARLVGYFVNPIVVRSDFAGGATFNDVLLQIQRSLDESAQHDWYPFPLLVNRLRPVRDLSRSPLIQVMFSWQKTTRLIQESHAATIALGHQGRRDDVNGLEMKIVPVPHQAATFELTVSAAESEDGLAVAFDFNTDLFERSTIRHMAACYRTVLDSVATAPDQPLSQIAILPLEERRKMLVEWNATRAPYPERTLHQLVERWAERTPEHVAVQCRQRKISYRELHKRAARVAGGLSRLGVGPGSLVGLCCDPSIEAVVGILGILKSGAAYVPVDASYPRDRQAFMLQEVRASALVVHRAEQDRIPAFDGPILDLDAEKNFGPGAGDATLSRSASPDDPAYVIFTSGSTGQPKGSALAHRGVVSLLTDFQRRQPIAPGDACSWWTSMSFDVSVYEIFSALIAGGALQIVPSEVRLDTSAVLEFLWARKVRHAYLPPFMLPDLADWLEDSRPHAVLRRLLVGVEPIPEQLLLTISQRLPGLKVINGYGPSEATICSTLYDVDPARPARGKTPIGKPVLNTRIYLLDRNLQPVPPGAAGEIFIGGIGLARGYLHRPELTAERFIADPFSKESGEKLYRSGDLARRLPDGNLEFLGRVDDQFKINGVRIEPAEIEAALVKHPGIHDAAALARRDKKGDRRLVAYLIPRDRPGPSARELRRFLAQSLPASMLPQRFVVLEALPQTPNGKLDRRRLPALEDVEFEPNWARRPARTEAEVALASIWRKALGLAEVGQDDNFFELGGDSITAMQIVSQAAKMGMRLDPNHIFQAPTIAELAALAEKPEPARGRAEQGTLVGDVPLTPIQHWFFEQRFPDPHHWNQSLVFKTRRRLDPDHLRSAIAALIAHHDALRLRFFETPSGWQARYAPVGDDVPCELVDIGSLSGHDQPIAIGESCAGWQRSLNLSKGPLIRVVYFDAGPERAGRLAIIVHHLACDAFSWRILLEDLETVYGQLNRGETISLPPKTTSYRQWARLLQRLARSRPLVEEANSWRLDRYGDWPPLPLDLAREDRAEALNLQGAARRLATRFQEAETEQLLRRASTRKGSRIAALLLTALARALRRWTGSRTMLIDLEGHGREGGFDGADLSRTVGWFTTLYPVRLQLPSTEEPKQSLISIENQLQRIPRRGLGYGPLRYLGEDRALRAAMRPIRPAEVSFNYLGRVRHPGEGALISALETDRVGPPFHPGGARPHFLEVEAAVRDGELQIDWIYGSRLHRPETIARLAKYFREELRTLEGCLEPVSPAKQSPSIFDLASNPTRSGPVEDEPAVANSNVDLAYALSPAQQGMLFHTLQAPGSGVYVGQLSCTIQGPLDVPSFSQAWRRLVGRHAVLRTAFEGDDLGQMLQVVHSDVEMPLELQDWRQLSAGEQQARLAALLATERIRGFEPGVAPLWHLTLARTAGSRHLCLFTYHHALLDGWSVAVLLRELWDLYDDLVHKREPMLPPVRPFSDYIDWLESQDLTAAESFWRTDLDGCRFSPSFPEGPAPGADDDLGVAAEEVDLDVEETSVLQRLARRRQLTLSTLLQGAWALLLARTSQRRDITYGLTVAIRPPDLTDSENMVGLLINTVPMRIDLDPMAPLIGWLDRLQRKAAQARQFAYCPLVQIRAWAGARPGRPLFDSIMAFENYPVEVRPVARKGGPRIIGVGSVEQTNYPLALAVIPGERLRLKISYDRSRFEPADIRRILADLEEILSSMAADPGRRLLELGGVAWPRLPAVQSVVGVGEWQPPTHVAPRSSLQHRMARLWAEVLGIERIGIKDDFFELGGNSLTAAVVVGKLGRELGTDLPLASIFEAPTIEELSERIRRPRPPSLPRLEQRPYQSRHWADPESGGSAPSALVPIQPEGSRPPLFCLHPAGGVVFPYYALARHLGEEQPLYGLQDPTLFTRGSKFGGIEEMAATYIEAVRSVQPDGPVRLVGWSVGGIIAYEMAQQFSRLGDEVSHLIILDTSAPGRRGNRRRDQGAAWKSIAAARSMARGFLELRSAVLPIASYVRSGLFLLATSARRDHQAPNAELELADLLSWAALDTWRDRLLGEAGLSIQVPGNSRLMLVEMPEVRAVLAKLRQHIRLSRRYLAQPYGGGLTLFRALPAGRDGRRSQDLTLGWAGLAAGGLEIQVIHANHVALMVDPFVEELAQGLAACLGSRRGGGMTLPEANLRAASRQGQGSSAVAEGL